MRIIRTKDYEEMSKMAANIIASQVILKPDSTLGLATGSTPIGTYKRLIEKYENGDLDFSKVTTVNLDEYKGITKDNDQSYYYFMNHNLFDHVNIDKARTFIPDGTEADADKACSDYNAIIHSLGGVDLQLLGIGHNGHIGFNEPSDHFEKETHCVNLAERTIKANRRFFESEEAVPKQAYTMGIQTIMSARHVLLLASGAEKADIIQAAFFGPITPQVPASILQLHGNVTIIVDEAAFSKCK